MMSFREKPAGENGAGRGAAAFCVGVMVCVGVFAVLFHAPVLSRQPVNADELIYLSLAARLAEGGPYSLQGTRLLTALPASMYDHAVFNHPPGFAWILVPWVRSPGGAVWVSVAALLTAVGAVGWASWAMLLHDRDTLPRRVLFLIPLIAVATDPILSFCVRRVWPDAMMSGLVALALAGGIVYGIGGRRVALLVAGIALAGAASMKLIAAFWLLPVLGMVLMRSRKVGDIALATVPLLSVITVWEIFFYSRTGALWPHWLRIGEEALRSNEFMAERAAQPLWFFPFTWLLLVPLVAPGIGGALFAWGRGSPVVRILLPSCLLLIVTLMVLGGGGVSKEARYLAPLTPALAMMLGAVFACWADAFSTRRQIFAVVCLLAVVAGATTAAFHLNALRIDEPVHPWMAR